MLNYLFCIALNLQPSSRSQSVATSRLGGHPRPPLQPVLRGRPECVYRFPARPRMMTTATQRTPMYIGIHLAYRPSFLRLFQGLGGGSTEGHNTAREGHSSATFHRSNTTPAYWRICNLEKLHFGEPASSRNVRLETLHILEPAFMRNCSFSVEF